MKYRIITPPVFEPVTLDEAVAHTHAIDDTTENNKLTALITAAREYCEMYTRRALATQTVEAYLDYFSGCSIELPMPPLQSVTSIKYTNSAGAETTMPTADYIVDTDSAPGRIVLPYGRTWPAFVPYTSNPIKITFIACGKGGILINGFISTDRCQS
jgi:uncharacterized phiE125 gp8 family phage protein